MGNQLPPGAYGLDSPESRHSQVSTMKSDLVLAAVYARDVAASLERVWENVHDWEHLPWLHHSEFSDIRLEEAGEWGWRAQVVGPKQAGAQRTHIELRREPGTNRYHTRTLDGPTRGADTVTTLTSEGPRLTHVRVDFWVPTGEPTQIRQWGTRLRRMYRQLWDEDERMMIERQDWLERSRMDTSEPVPLGDVKRLRDGLPTILKVGAQSFRILDVGGRLVAHSTRCPHWGGPLDRAPIEAESVVCPWHGDRFALEDGRNLSQRACQLRPLAFVHVSASGEAALHFEEPRPLPARAP